MTRDRTASLAIAGAILTGGCAPSPAGSEPQAKVLAVEQVAGFWALRTASGARCDLSLSNLIVDGVRPVLAERCGVPAAAGARRWRATATGVELLSADGAVILAFRRTGEDAFVSLDGGSTLSRAPLS